jgi:hypothetical protein
MTGALALCVGRSSTLPPPELSTMADTRQQQLSVNQSVSVVRGIGLRLVILSGPDDFLEKAKMYTILTDTEHREYLTVY